MFHSAPFHIFFMVCMVQSFILIGHLYLSSVRLGVILQMGIKQNTYFKEIGLRAQKIVNHSKFKESYRYQHHTT